MHLPDQKPRFSIFYDYEIHPFARPTELNGGTSSAPVVIVGAGPIGLLTAIELARSGVRSIVVESELQVSHGSRAIVLTRRSMEILQHADVAASFVSKGLQWSSGRSFYRGTEVYRMVMPHDDNDRFLPGLNIQQQYIEEYLVDAAVATGMVEMRWGSCVVGIAQSETEAVLRIDTPEGEYDLKTPWVVAADGGRSTIRKFLNLRMEGQSFPGNFVIADIKADIRLPTERLCYFDPSWNPGNNVLVHRQPDSLWRIDFRLPDGEAAEQALDREVLSKRIEHSLEMIGQKVPWELDWATVYSANTMTLPDYVAGRVIFTGDAAHLLPIFGVRGANTGFQDCDNLAWKLAAVVKGEADRKLLESYSSERVQAAREICDEGSKSTRFMTPPSTGYRLMRDAVLSLSLSEDFPKDLLHWRTSRPHSYAHSALNSFPKDNDAFDGGIPTGDPIRDVKLAEDDYFLDHLRQPGFYLLCFCGEANADKALETVLAATSSGRTRLTRVVIGRKISSSLKAAANAAIADPDGRIAARYAAVPGSAYLVRPDQHVCARWPQARAGAVSEALAIALGDAP
ncbi:MAG: FAD-dependent monooxygenase [Bradyrhizobium sp.]